MSSLSLKSRPERTARSFFGPGVGDLARALRSGSRRRAVVVSLVVLGSMPTVGCGSSTDLEAPARPVAVASADTSAVDVGGRVRLDGFSSTDPEDRMLTYTWRIVSHDLDFDDYCAGDDDSDPQNVCTSNENDLCSDADADCTDPSCFCDSDADCAEDAFCRTNSGDSSADCAVGICLLEGGDSGPVVSFVAESHGPYEVRMTAHTGISSDIDAITVETFPSLFVAGSLTEFGGTEGGLVRTLDEVETFAPNPVAVAASPVADEMVILDDSVGVLRRFDARSGAVLGDVGESDALVSDPAAMAFSSSGDFYVAEAGGDLHRFNGETGLYLGASGDVGAGVVSMLVHPEDGSILVADGVAGSGVRQYSADGTPVATPWGDTEAALVANAGGGSTSGILDLAANNDFVFLALSGGDVLRCGLDGSACVSLGGAIVSSFGGNAVAAVAVNPAEPGNGADLMLADPTGARVVACSLDGSECAAFGQTSGAASDFRDLAFWPVVFDSQE